MLLNIEGAQARFDAMAQEISTRGGPVWKAYVKHWSELVALWNEESPSGKCPKLYIRMKDLQNFALVGTL